MGFSSELGTTFLEAASAAARGATGGAILKAERLVGFQEQEDAQYSVVADDGTNIKQKGPNSTAQYNAIANGNQRLIGGVSNLSERTKLSAPATGINETDSASTTNAGKLSPAMQLNNALPYLVLAAVVIAFVMVRRG